MLVFLSLLLTVCLASKRQSTSDLSARKTFRDNSSSRRVRGECEEEDGFRIVFFEVPEGPADILMTDVDVGSLDFGKLSLTGKEVNPDCMSSLSTPIIVSPKSPEVETKAAPNPYQ